MQAQNDLGISYHYVDCECSDFGHVVRFVFDEVDGDLWLETRLNVHRPWYARIRDAIRHVFGRPPAYCGGHYDCTLIGPHEVLKITELLLRSVKRIEEADAQEAQSASADTQKNQR